MSFAFFPPEDASFLITQLWDKHLPDWREAMHRGPSDVARKRFGERVRRAWDEVKRGGTGSQEGADRHADFQLTQSWVPPRKGKWRIFPLEAEGLQARESPQ